jgi:hypothetical protein
MGNQLTDKKIKKVELKEALQYEEPPQTDHMEIEVANDEAVSGFDDESQTTLDF